MDWIIPSNFHGFPVAVGMILFKLLGLSWTFLDRHSSQYFECNSMTFPHGKDAIGTARPYLNSIGHSLFVLNVGHSLFDLNFIY